MSESVRYVWYANSESNIHPHTSRDVITLRGMDTLSGEITVNLFCSLNKALRKHAYSNIEKSSPPKTEKIQIKEL